jgi:hypothetical protein
MATSNINTAVTGPVPANPYIVGILAWFVPGAGHLIQRSWTPGALIFGIFWTMFIVAVLSGGAHYPGFGFGDGPLLYLLNVLGRLGSGLGALISWVIQSTPIKEVAALPTFEYGGRFLEVAGLINYLAAMDAVDISLGRKK